MSEDKPRALEILADQRRERIALQAEERWNFENRASNLLRLYVGFSGLLVTLVSISVSLFLSRSSPKPIDDSIESILDKSINNLTTFLEGLNLGFSSDAGSAVVAALVVLLTIEASLFGMRMVVSFNTVFKLLRPTSLDYGFETRPLRQISDRSQENSESVKTVLDRYEEKISENETELAELRDTWYECHKNLTGAVSNFGRGAVIIASIVMGNGIVLSMAFFYSLIGLLSESASIFQSSIFKISYIWDWKIDLVHIISIVGIFGMLQFQYWSPYWLSASSAGLVFVCWLAIAYLSGYLDLYEKIQFVIRNLMLSLIGMFITTIILLAFPVLFNIGTISILDFAVPVIAGFMYGIFGFLMRLAVFIIVLLYQCIIEVVRYWTRYRNTDRVS